jgi:hypothetical protein
VPTVVDANAPLLSVVIPTHDVEPWIRECMASILRQPVDSMELLVVDDHSTDGTVGIAAALQAGDARVRIITAVDEGGANARNLGAASARGKYLIFADGDDIVPDNAYRHLVESLEESGSDIAMGRFLKFSIKETWDPSARWGVFDVHKSGTTLAASPSLIRGRACWNKMFVRTFWQGHGFEFPEVVRSNDIAPMTAAMVKANSIDLIPECVYLYRARPGMQSMTARASKSNALRSYLGQELECLRMLIEAGQPRVLNEYFSLFLNSDGWVHVSNFLGTDGDLAPDVDLAVAAELLRRILALAPAGAFARLSAERRRVFKLVAEQRWDVLSHLDPQGKINTGAGPEALISIGALFEDARAILDYLPHDERGILLEGLRTRVLRPLLRDAHIMDEPELTALGLQITAYSEEFLTNVTGDLADAERTALNLCSAGRAKDIKRLSSLSLDLEITTHNVTCDGKRLTANLVVEGELLGRSIALIAKPRGGGDVIHASLASNTDRDNVITFALDQTQFAQHGYWDVFTVLSDDDLEIETLLTIGRMRQTPDGRRATFYIHPVKQPRGAVILVNRRSVLIRGWSRLRSDIRGRRSPTSQVAAAPLAT